MGGHVPSNGGRSSLQRKDLLFVSKNTARALSQGVRTLVYSAHINKQPVGLSTKKPDEHHRKPQIQATFITHRAPPGPTDGVAKGMFTFHHAPLARELSLDGAVRVLLNQGLLRPLSSCRGLQGFGVAPQLPPYVMLQASPFSSWGLSPAREVQLCSLTLQGLRLLSSPEQPRH